MYELGQAVSSLANLAFGVIGVWMAHSLYRTIRRPWVAVLVWVSLFAVWSLGAPMLQVVFPQVPYVRLSMLVGFSGILAYLFLFADIPVGQRIFAYFLVDTCMTLLVLLARTLAVLAEQLFALPGDVVFLAVYVPLTAAFLFVFSHWLRSYILEALMVFHAHLNSLAAFAAICYVTLLLQVDTWGPWPKLDFWTAGGRFGMIALVLAGYVLAFRTLATIRRRDAAEESARFLSDQLVLFERYYDNLVEQLEQTRMRDHDLRHHVNTLSGLCAQGDGLAVRNYVADMARELPPRRTLRFCDDAALNALFSHYADLCCAEKIDFTCQVQLSGGIESLHLCVIFGNALQNALEASLRIPGDMARFISVKAAPEGGRLAIAISNRYDGALKADGDGKLSSVKEEPGHGLGLTSIRETARRYGGWCGVKYTENEFTLMVTLKAGK